MLVSETSIFSSGSLTVRISSMNGTELSMKVSPDQTVDSVKFQAASHFFDPSESAKTSLYHRLLHVSSDTVLQENSSLSQAGIKDNDELILIKRRIPPVLLDVHQKEQQKQLPTEDAIKKATQNLQPANTDKKTPDAVKQGDFQSELRKILVSLIDVAQKLLALNPEAAKFFSDDDVKGAEAEAAPLSYPDIDQEALKMLKGMGFSGNRASRALIACNMQAHTAVQWLLEREGDKDLDKPLSTGASWGASQGAMAAKTSQPKAAPPTRSAAVSAIQATAMPSTSKFSSTSAKESDDAQLSELSRELLSITGPNKLHRMLDVFRAYRRREFVPNAQALKNLLEMGFEEEQSIDALQRQSNRQEEACEYLLASGETRTDPLEGVEDGLSHDSGIYMAIITNPVIQLGLNNPRSLIAFLHMLENPGHTQQWLSDPDTGPMLIQISRIYQSERHADSY